MKRSQSTLLISSLLLNNYPYLRGCGLRFKLKELLYDPDLALKMSLLKTGKVRKHYQSDGLDLVPVFFYPDDADWALLSVLSNGSGFSRCYVFIFLLLFNLGILKLPKDRTNAEFPQKSKPEFIYCCLKIHRTRKTYLRELEYR